MKAQLSNILAEIANSVGPGAPILIHSDLFLIGPLDKGRPPRAICGDYEQLLDEAFGDRPYLIPTFNYDFPRTGLYDLATTPPQVGVLPRHYAAKYPDCRTRTPVFNFVLRGTGWPSSLLEPSRNAFGDDSIFAWLRRERGAVVFLGAGVEANTFLHHVEHLADVPYRYLKTFRGQLRDGQGERPVEVSFHVRPRDVAEWKLSEIIERPALMAANVLRRRQLASGGCVEWFRAEDYVTYLTGLAGANPLTLLSPETLGAVTDLFNLYGYPLTFEAVEAKQQ